MAARRALVRLLSYNPGMAIDSTISRYRVAEKLENQVALTFFAALTAAGAAGSKG